MHQVAHFTLQRTHTNGPSTFGELLVDGRFICYTLEDEIREVFGKPVSEWKIKTATAIPSTNHTGHTYQLTLEHSPRFGPDTLTVKDVPGFTGVRMHSGNTPQDTEGCPLLGMAITETGIAGGTSRPAVQAVKTAVKEALGAGLTCRLEIINPTFEV
jgi:hypothetical protein